MDPDFFFHWCHQTAFVLEVTILAVGISDATTASGMTLPENDCITIDTGLTSARCCTIESEFGSGGSTGDRLLVSACSCSLSHVCSFVIVLLLNHQHSNKAMTPQKKKDGKYPDKKTITRIFTGGC